MAPGKIIVGIDPGLTGAIAIYQTGVPDRVNVHDMPVHDGEVNALALSHIIASYNIPTVACIENVNAMPRDGVVQAWRFGCAFATAKTVVSLLLIPMLLIRPAVWKKAMGLKGGPEGKEQSRRLATQTFPHNYVSFERKKDAGRAEAALLAYYASTKLKYLEAL